MSDNATDTNDDKIIDSLKQHFVMTVTATLEDGRKITQNVPICELK